jgi:hypothetical protein
MAVVVASGAACEGGLGAVSGPSPGDGAAAAAACAGSRTVVATPTLVALAGLASPFLMLVPSVMLVGVVGESRRGAVVVAVAVVVVFVASARFVSPTPTIEKGKEHRRGPRMATRTPPVRVANPGVTPKLLEPLLSSRGVSAAASFST